MSVTAFKRGDVVRNIGSGNTYVVVEVVNGIVIAARTIPVSNLLEWEKVDCSYEGYRVPPTLIDRSDGVKGHYTIGRSRDGRVYEYWDADRDLWCSAGTVFDYERANNWLRKWGL